jgi:hypothetical protein
VGLYRESVDVLLQLNDKFCAGKSLLGLGWVAHDTGDVERAETLGQQAVTLFRELQVRAEVAVALNLLGRVALAAGRLEAATELLREGFDVQRSMQHMREMAITLEDLARVAGAQGDATRMVKLLAAAAGIRQTHGVSSSAVERHTSEDAVSVGRAALDHAAFTSAWAEGAILTLEEAVALTGAASTGR